MVIESKTEQPIIPIQINRDQFLNIINIFQVKKKKNYVIM